MSRYIDADAAKKDAEDRGGSLWLTDGDVQEVKRFLDDQPTADVAPVVRCAECKFFNRDDATTNGKCRCDVNKLWQVAHFRPYRKFDDFCSQGAKMDEEAKEK